MVRTVIKFAWLPKLINKSPLNKKKLIWLRYYREYQVFRDQIEYNHWGVPNFTSHDWITIKRELI